MNITALNFTGVYERMDFLAQESIHMIDCKDIIGTSMYIDPSSEEILRRLLCDISPSGIHFLDNGNYHYMTRLFLEKLDEPFDLVVFDHHDDSQKPAFEGMRSCGSWIADAAEDFPDKLKSSTLIKGKDDIKISGKSDRARPVYISIDKDVLSKSEVPTNWDQGDMSLSELEHELRLLFESRRVIGVDICGECAPSSMGSGGADIFDIDELGLCNTANQRLLRLCSFEMEKAGYE